MSTHTLLLQHNERRRKKQTLCARVCKRVYVYECLTRIAIWLISVWNDLTDNRKMNAFRWTYLQSFNLSICSLCKQCSGMRLPQPPPPPTTHTPCRLQHIRIYLHIPSLGLVDCAPIYYTLALCLAYRIDRFTMHTEKERMSGQKNNLRHNNAEQQDHSSTAIGESVANTFRVSCAPDAYTKLWLCTCVSVCVCVHAADQRQSGQVDSWCSHSRVSWAG